MASTPDFKVYDSRRQYVGCCKEPHAAALLAQHYSGTARYGHGIKETLFDAENESDLAILNESFDTCSDLMLDRLNALRLQWKAAREAKQAAYNPKP